MISAMKTTKHIEEKVKPGEKEFSKYKIGPSLPRKGITLTAMAAIITISGLFFPGNAKADTPWNAAGRDGSPAAYAEQPEKRVVLANYDNACGFGELFYLNTPVSKEAVFNITLSRKNGERELFGRVAFATKNKIADVGIQTDITDIGGDSKTSWGFGFSRSMRVLGCNIVGFLHKLSGKWTRGADVGIGGSGVLSFRKENASPARFGGEISLGRFSPHLAADGHGYWEGGLGLPAIGPFSWGNIAGWTEGRSYGFYIAGGF
jgi:hypothetical protein